MKLSRSRLGGSEVAKSAAAVGSAWASCQETFCRALRLAEPSGKVVIQSIAAFGSVLARLLASWLIAFIWALPGGIADTKAAAVLGSCQASIPTMFWAIRLRSAPEESPCT